MEMDAITKYGVDVPILKTKVVLEPLTILKKYKARECASDLRNATIMSGGNQRKNKRKR